MQTKKRKLNKHLKRLLVFISLSAIIFLAYYAFNSYNLVSDGRGVVLEELVDRSFKARDDVVYLSIHETHVSVLTNEYKGDYAYEYSEGTLFVNADENGEEVFVSILANGNVSFYMLRSNTFLYEVKF